MVAVSERSWRGSRESSDSVSNGTRVLCELWAKTRLPGWLVYDGRRRRRRSSFDMGSVEFWRGGLCFPSCILDRMEAQRGVYQMVNDDSNQYSALLSTNNNWMKCVIIILIITAT